LGIWQFAKKERIICLMGSRFLNIRVFPAKPIRPRGARRRASFACPGRACGPAARPQAARRRAPLGRIGFAGI
jgi:hypothetical protein